MSRADEALWKRLLNGTRDGTPFVRADAARQLGVLCDARAADALAAMLEHDHHYSKITAVYALGYIGGRKAAGALRACASDPSVFDMPGFYNHDMIRLAAVLALLWNDDDSGLERIADLLGEDRLEAYVHLGQAILELPATATNAPLRDKVTRELLMDRFRQENAAIQGRVTGCMAYFPGAASRRFIVDQLSHMSRYVRAAAAQSLLRLKRSSANVEAVETLLKRDRTAFVQLKAAALLHEPGDPRAVRIVRRHIGDEDHFVRATALDALASLKEPVLEADAAARLGDEHPYVRLCAVEALAAMKRAPEARERKALLRDGDARVALAAARWAIEAQNAVTVAG
ncbi:MAG: HEAT repeat domain-containing protein [Phycisphaeraceae bacterium]